MNDAITVEVIRHALLASADEMARNLCRTAYNTVVYEIHDYGIGLHNADGDVIADAPGIAVFTRANDYGIKKSVEFLGVEQMRPGDVFMLNYPYWSSAHTLDVLVFAPIHVETTLIGYASCRVHVLDLKQKSPGYVLDSTDMYQEGMVFPVSRLVVAGEPNKEVLNLIRFNSRMPRQTLGDIQAQVSACITGVRQTRSIAARYGVDNLVSAMAAINAHGQTLARLALAKLPRGSWTAEDFMDTDGIDLDALVSLKVTVTVTEEEMVIDWRESATNVRGPINMPVGLTVAVSSLIFKAVTTPHTPVVAGNFAPLRVLTTPGSVMHAVPPMPTFTLWTSVLAGEVVLKALAQGMPEKIPACSGGDVNSVTALGLDPRTGADWQEGINDAVGFGAHAHGDGEDGIAHLSQPGCRNNPVEVLEARAPWILDHYGFRPDSAGAGRYRGGVGVERSYRFISESTAIALVYKTRTRPWGLAGGSDGMAASIMMNPGTARQSVQGGGTNYVHAGDVLVNRTGGGGGFGDPFDRDPAAVRDDVIDGFITATTAERDYGVVLAPGTDIDIDATAARRSRTVS